MVKSTPWRWWKDEAVARNATLKALAKEDCFTSTSGQRHDVDMSAGTNHESARRGRVHEALRPLQGRVTTVRHRPRASTCSWRRGPATATRQTHPSGSCSPSSETTALGPSNRRTSLIMRSARLWSGATLYASASALLSDWRPLRCHKRTG